MSKICRLSPELANQIAAGEVVERPASVVKELVENAIDAGARRISIVTEFGGKRLVRVVDDGEGMDPEDARLALERHATSKIARADDLAAITTLGFRGEALPAIASVSHLTLRTRARGAVTGTEIRAHAGTVVSIIEAGAPEGTLVEVADLFYNLPARRKFLKSDSAESAQISRLVTQLALGYPEIGFELTSGGRTVLQCPPVRSLRERFFQLYGQRPDLAEVGREAGGIRVGGFVAALADQGPTRGPQHVFVNRRIVKDRTVAHAVAEAYALASVRERSPEIHLFLEMPPEWVDVNVHPTKAEVRFRDQSTVHQIVRRAVEVALGTGPAPELQLRPAAAAGSAATTVPIPGLLSGSLSLGGWAPARSEPTGGAAPFGPAAPQGNGEVAGPSHAVDLPADAVADAILPMTPLGQFRDTYILAVDAEGIAIVDQHVAHERVLFEGILERLAGGRLESQRLLEPLVVELPPAGLQALATHVTDLDRFGLEIVEFGGRAVRVLAVPALLPPGDAVVAIRALADDLEGIDRGGRVVESLRRIAATMACHAAVKANLPLTLEKMTYILNELRRTAFSTVCPHGRPVMLRLTRREIERNFQRI